MGKNKSNTSTRECKDFSWLAIALVVAPAISPQVFDKFLIMCSLIATPTQGKNIFPNLTSSLELILPGTEHPWLCVQPVACFDLRGSFKDDVQC